MVYDQPIDKTSQFKHFLSLHLIMPGMSLDLQKLESTDPKIKYGFVKELLEKAKSNPGLLYPYFKDWVSLVNQDNNILKWTGIDLIGYMSAVDVDGKANDIIPVLIEFLHGGNLITCNHAIFALGLIAENKPEYRASILNELLRIRNAPFESPECKEIATGKVLLTFGNFLDSVKNKPQFIEFIYTAKESERPATGKKAETLIKKLEKLIP